MERDAGFQANHCVVVFVEAISGIVGVGGKSEGNPEIRSGRPAELRAHDADHAVGRPVQLDGPAKDGSILAEEPLPGGIGQYDHLVGLGLVFLGLEKAAEARFGAEDIEPLQGHGGALQPLRHPGAGVIVIALAEDCARLEQLGAFLDVGEIGNRDPDVFQCQLVVFDAERDDALGVRNAGGVQEHLVHDAEDGGVGADAEGERGDGGEAEGGAFGQGTASDAESGCHARGPLR